MNHYVINSSNELKIREFKKYLPGAISIVTKDLKEPYSDAFTIIRYKASQFDNVLVDDCSLEIEGASIGPMVKWHLQELGDYAESESVFICLLAIHKGNQVYIYQGRVKGKIVKSRGKKYGFLSYFQPIGATKTLAEHLPEKYNARYYAIQNYLHDVVDQIVEPLYEWKGLFQNEFI